jgi:hypothetical protein
MAKLWLALILLKVSAADFSAKVVDRLDRPLSGVVLEFSCRDSQFRFVSNEDGELKGDSPCGAPHLTFISKEGFRGYATGLRSKYVLDRVANAQELSRIATLEKEAQLKELGALFTGSPFDLRELSDALFHAEARWRPDLLKLAADYSYARSVLALIARPEDLDLLMTLPPGEAAWRPFVASSLIDPDDETEWSFLFDCAAGEFGDSAARQAILALKLTPTSRSQKVLEQARIRNTNKYLLPSIDNALEFVRSKPGPLADHDPQGLARRVALAIDAASWTGNGAPRFNEAQDKALVDLEFSGCAVRYTATFHHIDEKWVLRGVRNAYLGVIVDCFQVH